MVTTRPPKTIVKPTALSPVANTDTKLLIYGLFQKGRVLAQDGVLEFVCIFGHDAHRTTIGHRAGPSVHKTTPRDPRNLFHRVRR